MEKIYLAIEERKNRQVICETKQFSASRVKGIYAKSKAEATAYVQKAAERELGYSLRPVEETLADITFWLRREK